MSYIKSNKYYNFNKSHTGCDLATKDEIIRFPEKISIIYGRKGYGKTYHEIERLLKEKDKEIERLNNIINAIEKLCIDNLIYDELGMKVLDQPFILDKINELKGSD